METNALFYKIKTGIVSSEDYIKWSHNLIESNMSSPSLSIMSSLSSDENIFEVEHYFRRALKELGIKEPTMETSDRAYISFLVSDIVKTERTSEIFDLAYKVFRIVVDLQYPEDLIAWYEISEKIDQLQYDESPLEFDEEDLKMMIKNEANLILEEKK
ncbi:hypothetical protein NC661_03580 [Aquibacillus koreensis]|uniref:Uncharacterized protein n=1 Tax=Aquibacillus koreensis TaxID=279446 RepID=A0A9X3WI90_9BACI|nr:hypothetical protein [Aquibacillus koreensis]MCT2536469.1 hypothetical protein [Aquibacillus koreensis]MDC3419443.1 hypothetical protein [Aquibacillus koreensis]